MPKRGKLIKACLLSIIFFVLLNALWKSNQQPVVEPKFGKYVSDEMIFLKTFYLTRQTGKYYQSYKLAFENKIGGIKIDANPQLWRLPTSTYVWLGTSNSGNDILHVWWLLASCSVGAIFLLVKKFSSSTTGLVSALLVSLYFSGITAYKTLFLFTEWWALFPFIFGLAFYMYERKRTAWLCFLLAISIRELMVLPIGVMFLVSLAFKKDRAYFLTLILAYLGIVSFHGQQIAKLFNKNHVPGMGFPRLHGFDVDIVKKFLAFSMSGFPLINFKSHMIIGVFSIGLAGYMIVKKIRNRLFVLLYAPLLICLGFFPFVNTTAYTDYWAICCMPLLISLLPLGVFTYFHTKTPLKPFVPFR